MPWPQAQGQAQGQQTARHTLPVAGAQGERAPRHCTFSSTCSGGVGGLVGRQPTHWLPGAVDSRPPDDCCCSQRVTGSTQRVHTTPGGALVYCTTTRSYVQRQYMLKYDKYSMCRCMQNRGQLHTLLQAVLVKIAVGPQSAATALRSCTPYATQGICSTAIGLNDAVHVLKGLQHSRCCKCTPHDASYTTSQHSGGR